MNNTDLVGNLDNKHNSSNMDNQILQLDDHTFYSSLLLYKVKF